MPGEDALGVLGKGFIPHQVDAKMDYMNIPAAPSAGEHDGKSLHNNTVHHGPYGQNPRSSSAQANGKAPMYPDDAFDGTDSNTYCSGGGAPAIDRQGPVPNLKRGRESISGSAFDNSNTAGHSRRRIGDDDHPGTADEDEGTPTPVLSGNAVTPGDSSDAQISSDRAADTTTDTSQCAPHEFDASAPKGCCLAIITMRHLRPTFSNGIWWDSI